MRGVLIFEKRGWRGEKKKRRFHQVPVASFVFLFDRSRRRSIFLSSSRPGKFATIRCLPLPTTGSGRALLATDRDRARRRARKGTGDRCPGQQKLAKRGENGLSFPPLEALSIEHERETNERASERRIAERRERSRSSISAPLALLADASYPLSHHSRRRPTIKIKPTEGAALRWAAKATCGGVVFFPIEKKEKRRTVRVCRVKRKKRKKNPKIRRRLAPASGAWNVFPCPEADKQCRDHVAGWRWGIPIDAQGRQNGT